MENSGFATPGIRAPLYEQAVGVLVLSGGVSTFYLQRMLGLSYNEAKRLMEMAEADGIVTRPDSVGRRELLAVPFRRGQK